MNFTELTAAQPHIELNIHHTHVEKYVPYIKKQTTPDVPSSPKRANAITNTQPKDCHCLSVEEMRTSHSIC